MAVDEAILLSHSREKTPPTLRFYTWIPPGISIGYFQKISEKEKNTWDKLNIPFVRRLSGGRAVYHNNDLTYSFIIREEYNLLPKNISESCEIIGRCLYQGLRSFGLSEKFLEINYRKKLVRRGGNTEYRTQNTENCFKLLSQGEILFDKRKLIGSAQVRKKGAILQHGSILVNYLPVWDNDSNLQKMITLKEILGRPVEFKKIIPFIVSGFEEVFDIKFNAGELTAEEKNLARGLEVKYREEKKC